MNNLINNAIEVSGLYIYPVKSMRGIALNSAKLTSTGLEHDRQWAIAHTKTPTGLASQKGKKNTLEQSKEPSITPSIHETATILTQRQRPQMAKIQPTLTDTGIELSMPDNPNIAPLNVTIPSSGSETLNVSIWGDTCKGLVANKEASDWLMHALELSNDNSTSSYASTSSIELFLVYFDKHHNREPAQLDRFKQQHTYFADAAPYLITNEASLNALNQHLAAQNIDSVAMENFRPNIIIKGIEAFGEHAIETLHWKNCDNTNNNNSRLRFIDHCQRCSIISLDPKTGQRRYQANPFKELAQINPMPGNKRAPAFGVNTIVELSTESHENTFLKVGTILSATTAV